MRRYAYLLSLIIVAGSAFIAVQAWDLMGGPVPHESSTHSSSAAFNSRSNATAVQPGINNTDLPLQVPNGFQIDVLADDLIGARVIVQDGFGNFWVSRPSAGVVTHLEMSGSSVRTQSDIFRGMHNPHGLAIDPSNGIDLYIAEETKISRARLYSDAPLETVATLPAGGRHTTRTLGFGPDDRLYVSIGSTCDVCVEKNDLHGTIISMKKDGTDQQIVAGGLRNAVFFTWNPVDGSMWATEMGRDMLGNNLPPEEVNIIEKGRTYGWPYCYGNQVRDISFEPSTQADCSQTNPPKITLPAHVAPLGIAFIPEEEGGPTHRDVQGWPEDYWYDLLVAEHGSWNSTVPVGYKVVRIPLDAQGNQEGEPVDFLSGFTQGRSAEGRPVDVITQPGGIVYITDDKAGLVYRVTVQAPAQVTAE